MLATAIDTAISDVLNTHGTAAGLPTMVWSCPDSPDVDIHFEAPPTMSDGEKAGAVARWGVALALGSVFSGWWRGYVGEWCVDGGLDAEQEISTPTEFPATQVDREQLAVDIGRAIMRTINNWGAARQLPALVWERSQIPEVNLQADHFDHPIEGEWQAFQHWALALGLRSLSGGDDPDPIYTGWIGNWTIWLDTGAKTDRPLGDPAS